MSEKQNDTGPLQPFHAASVRLIKCMHLCQLHQQSCPLFIFHLEVNQSNALCHMILYHHCRHTSTVPLLHTYMYGIVSASLVPSRKKKHCALFLILFQIFTRSGRNLSMSIETLHFSIIAIQKTGSVSYTCIRLVFSPLCGFNYAN